MSWWDAGDGNIIGDIPADILVETFREIAKSTERQIGQKPTLETVLSQISMALVKTLESLSASDNLIDDHLVLVAAFDNGQKVASQAAVDVIDSSHVDTLLKAFRLIISEYEESVGRAPTAKEMIYCVEFVLGSQTANYVSISPSLFMLSVTYKR